MLALDAAEMILPCRSVPDTHISVPCRLICTGKAIVAVSSTLTCVSIRLVGVYSTLACVSSALIACPAHSRMRPNLSKSRDDLHVSARARDSQGLILALA